MSSEPLPLSLVLIAHNEEHRIGRCLESAVHLASEVIVVVNDCTDRTVEIAKSYGARVYEHAWPGARDQKNIALGYVTQPWVLALDCDEELSETLQHGIREFFTSGKQDTYETAYFSRKTWFLGRWIEHGDWSPDHCTRVFKRGVRNTGSLEHDKIEVPGKAWKLKGHCYHYTNPSLTDQIEKINFFSDAFLKRQLEAGKKWSLLQTLVRPCWRFIRAYFFRRGFQDGFPGLYIACVTWFSTLVRYTRLYEAQQLQTPPAISLVVSTYQAPQALRLILEQVMAEHRFFVEVLIAEDAQDAKTREVVQPFMASFPQQIRHLTQADQGFRKSRILNLALAEAKGNLIVFLDGDCLPHSHFIRDHLALAQAGHFVQGRRAYVKQSAVKEVYEKGFRFWPLLFKGRLHGLAKAFRWLRPRVKIDQSLDKALGCNLAVWKHDLLAVNGLDEAYEGWGREDSDLVARLYHLGLKRKLVHGRAIVFHLDHAEESRDQLSRNDARLNEVLAQKTVRCERGVVQEQPAEESA